jgi:hypothetical protein
VRSRVASASEPPMKSGFACLLKRYCMDAPGTSICIVPPDVFRVRPYLTRLTPVMTICSNAAREVEHISRRLTIRSL